MRRYCGFYSIALHLREGLHKCKVVGFRHIWLDVVWYGLEIRVFFHILFDFVLNFQWAEYTKYVVFLNVFCNVVCVRCCVSIGAE